MNFLAVASFIVSLLALGSSWLPPVIESQIALRSSRNLACFATRLVTTNLTLIKKREDWETILPTSSRDIAVYSLKQIDYKSINYPEIVKSLIEIQYVMERVDKIAASNGVDANEMTARSNRMKTNIINLNETLRSKTLFTPG